VGDHRLVALRCGHLFGKTCIERWIGERRTCPNCNAGVQRADVLTLFSDHVAVVDNSGLEDMAEKLRVENRKCVDLNMQLVAAKMQLLETKKQLETKTSEAARASGELSKLKKSYADWRRGREQQQFVQAAAAAPNGSGQAASSTARLAASDYTRPRRATTVSTQLLQPCGAVLSAVPARPLVEGDTDELTAAVGNYEPVFDVPLRSARVFSIASSCKSVCVGEKLARDSYGILVLNPNDRRRRTRVPIHKAEVRDLCFWELESHVLTVAFDGKLAVTNVREQKVMVEVELPPGREGWSCTFSEADPNAMFCGFQDGTVVQYDMRKPADGEQGIVKNFSLPEARPVHSLKVFKSCDSSECLAAATSRGVSIWKDVAQVTGNGNQPVVGGSSTGVTPFSHATSGQLCYSLASNQLNSSQMAVSTRAMPVMHSLFNLRTFQSGQLRRTTVVAGRQAASVLSRSALWSQPDGTSILASWAHDIERVTLFDFAARREAPGPTALSMASSSMPVVAIQHAVAYGTWNSGTALLGTMASRQLCLYRRTP
jgi:hypothetical protein